MIKRSIAMAAAFVFAALMISVPAVSAQSGSRMDRKIRREIMTLPYYGVFDVIGYQNDNGVITLSGYVVRPLTKKEAAAAVSDVDGVQRVVNNIEVLPVSPNDDRIRQRMLHQLSNTGGLYKYFLGANPAIRIIVDRGRVSLEGYVNNRSDANLAYITARSVPGTFGVKNELRVLDEPK